MENQVIQNIMQRRSCRTFDPNRMPSDDLLSQVAEAGTWSPTSMGQQNPIIVVVTDRQLRDKISEMNARIMGTNSDPFYGAPCMIIVLVKKSVNALFDGPIVMQTMMLAAESLGLKASRATISASAISPLATPTSLSPSLSPAKQTTSIGQNSQPPCSTRYRKTSRSVGKS